MTNKEILNTYEALSKLNKSDIKFNIKVSYKLAKNKKILQPFYEAIISARYKKLIEIGEQNKDGTITIPNEKIDEADKIIKDLFEIDNKIELEKISLEELEEYDLEFDIIDGLYNIIK